MLLLLLLLCCCGGVILLLLFPTDLSAEHPGRDEPTSADRHHDVGFELLVRVSGRGTVSVSGEMARVGGRGNGTRGVGARSVGWGILCAWGGGRDGARRIVL